MTLLTSATGAARRSQLAEIESGALHLVVGTHALVQGDVRFKQLGLVVIDEQHRFGVLQRATLRGKGLRPDVLVMTATPIPRTLALTLYGDLDVSIIRDTPPGRQPIKTAAKPESRKDDVHQFVRQQLDLGRQAYVIYPLVEESEKVDLKAATEMADHLAQDVFPQVPRRLAARPVEGRRQGAGDEGVRGRRAAGAGVDDGRGSRRRRAERERDGGRARGTLRARSCTNCAGGWPGPSPVALLSALSIAAVEDARERLRAMTDTTGRLRDCGAIWAARAGDFLRHAPGGAPTFRLIDLVRDREALELAQREAAEWFESGPAPAALAQLLQTGERFSSLKLVSAA